MNSGKLDRLVTIIAPGKPAETDEWNETVGPEPVRVQAWAAIKTAPGTERFQSGENLALAPLRFFFRWRADLVKPDYQIEFDGKTFDVKSVEEVGRRQLLQVGAVARAL
jgi:head-tail adaptor